MTKAELAKEISSKTGIDQKVTLRIVEELMDSIKCSLSNEEEV